MESTQTNKQLVYERYLKMLHLHERLVDTEIDVFFGMADHELPANCPRSLSAVHVIDCIGQHEPINNTAIADKMALSKASITKIGSKLLEDGFVKRSQLEDNKKEFYYRLTAQGKKIFDLHKQMHDAEANRFYRFLDKYSNDQLKLIRLFLQDYNTELEFRMGEALGPTEQSRDIDSGME